MLTFTIINTLLQTNVDDQMRGRVMGLYTLTFFGFAPFGNLAIGHAGGTVGHEFDHLAQRGLRADSVRRSSFCWCRNCGRWRNLNHA